tara:strand:- start:89 stop:274 length:186 start_codon:yes stop_codon:yes gene_type:complete
MFVMIWPFAEMSSVSLGILLYDREGEHGMRSRSGANMLSQQFVLGGYLEIKKPVLTEGVSN